MAASNTAAWRLRLLYLNYYLTWEGGVLSFRPLQIQGIEWNNQRLIIVNKYKMADPRWLHGAYNGYNITITTQSRNMMFFWSQLNYHRLFISYFSQIQDGDIQDGDIQDGVSFL